MEECEVGRRVKLLGNWNLLRHAHVLARLKQELSGLESPQRLTWDLEEIESFDSGAAVLLWELWGRQFPDKLNCPKAYRRWFERLAEAPSLAPPSQTNLFTPLTRLGEQLFAVVLSSGEVLLLTGQLILDFVYCVTHPRIIPWAEISATIYQAGASSIILLGMIGFLIGAVLAVQIGISVAPLGATAMIIDMLTLAVLREIGPVITALIVIARTGSVITATIGAMHITQEFSALRTFGASPRLRLVLPRVIGMAVAIPLLVMWTDVMAILGGIVIAQMDFGIDHQLALARLPGSVPMLNFWLGLCKGVVYGLTIAIVASYFGLNAKPDTGSLSHQITNSVVTGLTLILCIDVLAGVLLIEVGRS
jgi:phospholipid/cholesterol/gamma-HCH transport system permease protein